MNTQDTQTEQFTVLVLRPDYTTRDYGTDTFIAHVSATSVAAAQEAVQKEAAAADREEWHQDYAVLMVVRGHHFNVKED